MLSRAEQLARPARDRRRLRVVRVTKRVVKKADGRYLIYYEKKR